MMMMMMMMMSTFKMQTFPASDTDMLRALEVEEQQQQQQQQEQKLILVEELEFQPFVRADLE